MTASFVLRPGLRAGDYAEAYARDGHVQIEGLLPDGAAVALAAALEQATPWKLAHSDPRGGAVMTRLDAPPEDLRVHLAGVLRQASEGFAYLYLVYPMIEAYLAGRDPGHPLHALTEFLNSPEFIAFAAAVTGEPVVKVDAQATLYRPGDFLTRHDDRGVGERRAAYTLSLTRGWRPDWGGQLLFHDDGGDVVRGLAPRFNVLTFFRVPLWHSVAPVAPYAARPRLTIAGWLRDDPAYSAP